MRVLVTGATGYIGSHTVMLLLEQGYEVLAVDNFSNSNSDSLIRLQQIAPKPFIFKEADVCDYNEMDEILEANPCDATIHFAGFKSVGESISKPIEYYENNLLSTINLLKLAKNKPYILGPKIIFSSSANIYGNADVQPVSEESTTGSGLTNPYGKTKYFCEEILRDMCAAQDDFQAICLRYFNPIGAHHSGMIGESPDKIPNNIAPFITKVASGELPEILVFGNDYDTKDGSGVRDFIHVMDLAAGHIAALKFDKAGFHAYNLGTGVGTSVLELIEEFRNATSKPIPYSIVGRRQGDIALSIANPEKSKKDLQWSSEMTIKQACESAWAWEQFRKNGLK